MHVPRRPPEKCVVCHGVQTCSVQSKYLINLCMSRQWFCRTLLTVFPLGWEEPRYNEGGTSPHQDSKAIDGTVAYPGNRDDQHAEACCEDETEDENTDGYQLTNQGEPVN